MALSDQLTKLAAQTKNQLGDQMIQDGNDATDDWVIAQKNVSDAFNSIHAKAAARRAARKAKHAENVAEDSEWDAEDAVEFAIYAIQEAEYALLQAATDREKADKLGS